MEKCFRQHGICIFPDSEELFGTANIFEVMFAYFNIVYVTFHSFVQGNFGCLLEGMAKKPYPNIVTEKRPNHQKKVAFA